MGSAPSTPNSAHRRKVTSRRASRSLRPKRSRHAVYRRPLRSRAWTTTASHSRRISLSRCFRHQSDRQRADLVLKVLILPCLDGGVFLYQRLHGLQQNPRPEKRIR